MIFRRSRPCAYIRFFRFYVHFLHRKLFDIQLNWVALREDNPEILFLHNGRAKRHRAEACAWARTDVRVHLCLPLFTFCLFLKSKVVLFVRIVSFGCISCVFVFGRITNIGIIYENGKLKTCEICTDRWTKVIWIMCIDDICDEKHFRL